MMCDIGSALAIGGALIKGFGSVLGGSSANRAAKYQAALLREQGDLAAKKGYFEEGRIRDRVDRVASGQTAYFAANGIDPTYGSPAVLAGLTAQQGEIDALIARAEGLIGKANAYAGAYSATSKGADAMRGGLIGAATSILQGLGADKGVNWGGGGSSSAGSPMPLSSAPGLLDRIWFGGA